MQFRLFSGGGFAEKCLAAPQSGHPVTMTIILTILAAVLVIAGIVSLFRGQMLWGIVLIIVGLLVGPGGYTIFNA